MTDNNLPEIDLAKINTEKRKKKGFLPWLSGGAGGSGASGGLGGLFAGKSAALFVTLAVTGLAVGTGLVVSNLGDKSAQTKKAFQSQNIGAPVGGASQGQYVPGMERARRSQSGVSSLAMFAEGNKGKIAGVGDFAVSEESQRDEEQESDAAAQEPVAGEMAEQLAGRLIGEQMGGLSSQLGGGSNRFKGWSGRFDNKFGNTFGTKGVGSDGVMGSFQRPTFKKNKLLSMRRPRAISGRRSTISHKGVGKKSLDQAFGVKKQQKGYTTSIDSAKSTQDKAWEGTTGGDGGMDTGGGGIGSGGAGLVTSPSLDNLNQAVGGDDLNDDFNYIAPTTTPPDASPWAELVKWAGIALMVANLLIVIVSLMSKIANILMSNPWTWAAGAALKVKAAYVALYVAGTLGAGVAAAGVYIMTQYGQTLLGSVYTIAGGVTAVTAFAALAGVKMFCNNMLVLAAVSQVIALIGSFATAPEPPTIE